MSGRENPRNLLPLIGQKLANPFPHQCRRHMHTPPGSNRPEAIAAPRRPNPCVKMPAGDVPQSLLIAEHQIVTHHCTWQCQCWQRGHWVLGSKVPTSTLSDSDIVMGRTPLPEAKVNASTSPRHWRAGEGAGEAGAREGGRTSFIFVD